ncbi:MAG: hypothetical protein AAF514_11365, partial [Verrucomicrobiota bacterium]
SSEPSLKRVIEDLRLDRQWHLSSRKASKRLRDQLKLEAKGKFDVVYFDPSPARAAAIANSLAKHYLNQRRDTEARRIENIVKTLTAGTETQNSNVESARLKMLEIHRSYDVSGLSLVQGSEDLSEAATTRIQHQIKSLEGLSGDTLIHSVIGLGLNNEVIDILLPKLEHLEKESETLSNLGLGAKHPKVIATHRKADHLRKNLEATADAIRQSLSTRLKMAADIRASPEEKNRFIEYNEARMNYDRQKALLANLKTKLATASAALERPEAPLIILEQAKPAEHPSKPNVSLNLAVGAIGGTLLGLLLATFRFFQPDREVSQSAPAGFSIQDRR